MLASVRGDIGHRVVNPGVRFRGSFSSSPVPHEAAVPSLEA